MANTENKDVSWSAPEFETHDRSPVWYIGLAILAIITIAYAVWQRDYTMLITLGVIYTAVYLYAHKSPETIEVNISPLGIGLNEQWYPYERLRSFWIIYRPPQIKVLYISTNDYVVREVAIQLGDQDPNPVRDILLKHLPEDLEREEPTTDQLLRRLKF